MAEPGEKLGPSITSFGAGVTKGKIAGGAVEVEETIAEIIRSWKHLIGNTLVHTLEDFGAKTRASAHLIIEWIVRKDEGEEGRGGSGGGGGGFTLPVDLLSYLKNIDPSNRNKNLERERGRGTPKRKMPLIRPKT
jgi:hypothetical protein